MQDALENQKALSGALRGFRGVVYLKHLQFHGTPSLRLRNRNPISSLPETYIYHKPETPRQACGVAVEFHRCVLGGSGDVVAKAISTLGSATVI